MQDRKRIKPVLAVSSVTVTDGYVDVRPDQHYAFDILPYASGELGREVLLGSGSRVDGLVFGKVVTLSSGHSRDDSDMTRALGIFAEESATLEDYCKVATHVQSYNDIFIGDSCQIFGDVIGGRISYVGDGTRIAGNIISEGDITLGSDVWVGGQVISLSGNIAINDNCKVYDVVSAGDIEIGDNVIVIDKAMQSDKGALNRYGKVEVDDVEFSKQDTGTRSIGSVERNLLKPNGINVNESIFLDADYSSQKDELNETLTIVQRAISN